MGTQNSPSRLIAALFSMIPTEGWSFIKMFNFVSQKYSSSDELSSNVVQAEHGVTASIS